MYLIERIEFGTVTGRWEYSSLEEAKRKWISLNESPYLYPLLTIAGEPYTIAQAERLFCVKEENKKRFGWGKGKMTKKELSQLYHLNLEIQEENERLKQLEAAASDISVKISGLPHMSGVSNKTALAAEIADCKNIIEAKKQAAVVEYNRLIRYISSIDDSFIRRILELRYIDCKSWRQVARGIGGNNTEDSVKQAHSRFLRK